MRARAPGFVVWLTGLPCSGKSTIAWELATRLRATHPVEVLDGDEVRLWLTRGLGFSREDRDQNVRRIGRVAELLARNGVAVIVAAVSPYELARQQARERIERFVEVWVNCPLNECERRDVKGMYRKAWNGEISNFTGVSDKYEPPTEPEVTVNTLSESVAESASRVFSALERLALLPSLSASVEEPEHASQGNGQPRPDSDELSVRL